MVDRDRVLAKLDELDGYLDELRSVTPRDLEEYARVETVRDRLADFGIFRRAVLDFLRGR